MNLKEIAKQAMNYLDDNHIPCEFEIHREIKRKDEKESRMPEHYYSYRNDSHQNDFVFGEPRYVEFTYQYDLLVIYVLGEKVMLPLVTDSTCKDYLSKFNFETEKDRFYGKLCRIVNRYHDKQQAEREKRFLERYSWA